MLQENEIRGATLEETYWLIGTQGATQEQMLLMIGKDIIFDDVRSLLGANGQEVQTWNDVDSFMWKNSTRMDPLVVKKIDDKLVHQYIIKKNKVNVMKASQEAKEKEEQTSNEESVGPSSAPITTELPPPRDYRTAADPTDHGRAMREQILNPPPGPCNPQ
ncbi:hypothetical protein IMSHALPRED_001036 [Imshaugia aleurites]|uniref:Uncharacterized protein n=1 Tax=Imshaugia aleurites TaxID=172621 RepID=A0A8H3PEH3_9LECA|nr:hypothetical protein IMSHALPRED_001036 [Imshaugia aleurites]